MRFGDVVNLFQCCLLTWDFVPVVVPAFLLAGAIAVFAPRAAVMRAVGGGAARASAYLAAACAGVVAALCSCNVVPVAASIRRRGAGIGPAFTFLFAGPALNIVTVVWVFHIMGVRLGVWRSVAAPLIGLIVGLIMAAIFGRQKGVAACQLGEVADASHASGAVVALFGLLLATQVLGVRGLPATVRLPLLVLCAGWLAWSAPRSFPYEDLRQWMHETGAYLKLVLPILIPAVLVIGLLQNYAGDWLFDHLYPLVGANTIGGAFVAAAIGGLLYFPLLTEVLLVKVLLVQNMMATGPALALLLTGPGLSIPGGVLLARLFGWRMTLAYLTLVIIMGGIVGAAFGVLYADAPCACQLVPDPTASSNPASIAATAIILLAMGIGTLRARTIRRPVRAAG